MKAVDGTSMRSQNRSRMATSRMDGFGSRSSGIHLPFAWATGSAPVSTNDASSGRQKCFGRSLSEMNSLTGAVVCTLKQRTGMMSPGVHPAGAKARTWRMTLLDRVLLTFGWTSVPSMRLTTASVNQMFTPMQLLRVSFPTRKWNALANGGTSDSS